MDPVVSRIRQGARTALLGGGPWWRTLPSDFHRLDDPFDLEPADRLPARLTAGADTVLRALGATLVAATALPAAYGPWSLGAVRRDLEFYGRIVEEGDRDALFRPPPRVGVEQRPARFPRFRPRDGSCVDLTFTSPFVPAQQRLAATFERHRRNRVVRARWWRHRSGRRPTLIAVHGFSADLYLVNEWFFSLPWLYRMGADVLLFTLPFHGARASLASPYSGHGFFAGGLGRTNEAFAQAVLELRALVTHLLEVERVPAVGVTGVSLGGFTSALLASMEDRLACAIPNVPVASLPDLALEWEPMGTVLRGLMRAAAIPFEDARRACAAACPLTWAPVVRFEGRMLIGGAADRLAPPKHTRLLWEHWDRCRLHWFPGSHLLHLDRGDYLWQIARFLRGIGFLPPDHPAP